jgi:hypothetical protein
MRLNSVGSEQAITDREDVGRDQSVDRPDSRGWLVSLTSLVFIVLQSACSVAMAISGIRVLIGLGALAAVTAGAQVPPRRSSPRRDPHPDDDRCGCGVAH